MMDDDLKKMLSDLQMDDLIEEPEQQKPPRFTPRMAVFFAVAVVAVVVLASFFFYSPETAPRVESQLVADADEARGEYDYENPYRDREEAAAAWGRKIAAIDPAIGRPVHELWSELRQRKDDLDDAASDLSTLLFDNARRREDFYAKEAQVLLSRYQAIDARHSLKIANSINALYAAIQKKHNPDLNQAYAEMLAELGAESYSTHQVQISKELLLQETEYHLALQAVSESRTLQELYGNRQMAQEKLAAFETNGVMQTFSQVDLFQKQLTPTVTGCLQKILFDSKGVTFEPEDLPYLKALVAESGQTEKEEYIEQFQRLLKKEEKPQDCPVA